MSELENKLICPEDVVRVLLPAKAIPDRATVSKRTGESTYTFRRKLDIYQVAGKAPEANPLTIEGFFLISDRGDVNQVEDGKLLHWHVTAEDLIEILQRSWEGPEQ